MFGPLGFQEVLFILVLALLIFGPKRLPEIGRTIGKGMAQSRKASHDLKRSIESEISLEDEPPARRPASFAPPRTAPSRHIENAAPPAEAEEPAAEAKETVAEAERPVTEPPKPVAASPAVAPPAAAPAPTAEGERASSEPD